MGSSRAMESLVARSWLDSVVAVRDEDALEAWLAAYGTCGTGAVVSQGLVAFAKSYDAWSGGDFSGKLGRYEISWG